MRWSDLLRALIPQPIDTKAAVRDIFEGMETLVKLLTNSNKNLDEAMIKKALAPLLRQIPEYNEPSTSSTTDRFIEGLITWVNAAHRYRHGQKPQEPIAPSLASGVLFLSTGAAYIRWLVDQLGGS